METERRRRAAAAFIQMRQDKLLELLFTQLRGNASPLLAFRHIECQSDGILHSSLVSEPILARWSFEPKFSSKKTSNQLKADLADALAVNQMLWPLHKSAREKKIMDIHNTHTLIGWTQTWRDMALRPGSPAV